MRGAGEGGGTVGSGGELQASQGQSALSQDGTHKPSGEGWPGLGSCRGHGLSHPIPETEEAPWVSEAQRSKPGALGEKGALDRESGAGVSVLYSLAV